MGWAWGWGSLRGVGETVGWRWDCGGGCWWCLFFFSSRRRHTRSYGDWIQTCALPIYRALRHPRQRLVAIHLDQRRVGAWMVMTEGRDKAAVPGRARVRHHDTEIGLSLASHAPQSDASRHASCPNSRWKKPVHLPRAPRKIRPEK